MKFSKLFRIFSDANNVAEKYISVDELYQFIQRNDGKANKYNIKRSLQTFQGGQKTICGKESATVEAVLKFIFSYSNNSKICSSIVKNIQQELLSGETSNTPRSSLDLYKQIAKANIHQNACGFEQVDIDEHKIVTLIVEHKLYFTASEWKKICWFENSFSREIHLRHSDLSYEEILDCKYAKYQTILNLIDWSKKWVRESESSIQEKTLRYQASDRENQIKIASHHIADILDGDIKSLIDIYCPDSIGQAVCFDLTRSDVPNSVWVVLVQSQEIQVSFNDLCSRIFYMLKRRHGVYLESAILLKTEELKDYVAEDGNVYRFFLRDSMETKQLKSILKVWQAGQLIDGTIDDEDDFQCQACFSSIVSKPLSADQFDIVQEWYLETPIETHLQSDQSIRLGLFSIL